jgi:hypothetical protein
LLLDENHFTGAAEYICRVETINVTYFSSDCGHDDQHPTEIVCECCNVCCHDGDATCNDLDWYGNIDPSWEEDFERGRYEFGQGEMYIIP